MLSKSVLFSRKVLIEIPYVLAQVRMYSIIVYVMIRFDWTVLKFFWYVFFTFFTLLYCTLFGMMTVVVTLNADIIAIIVAAFFAYRIFLRIFIMPWPVIFLEIKRT